MKTTILLILGGFTLNSCVTLSNLGSGLMHVASNKATKIKIKDDTLKTVNSTHTTFTESSGGFPEVLAFNDQGQKASKINLGTPLEYWSTDHPVAVRPESMNKSKPEHYTYLKDDHIFLNKKENSRPTCKSLHSGPNKLRDVLLITPLKVFSIINPGFEIGYEKRTGINFSTQLMARYLLPENFWESRGFYTGMTKIKGFQFSIEEKYYTEEPSSSRPYISFEFSYLQNKYQYIGWFGSSYPSQSGTSYTNYIDTIRIDKKTYSFNLKAGYQFMIRRFIIDVYFGFGARYKDVAHLDKRIPNDPLEPVFLVGLRYFANQEGKRWGISVPMNIRIGYTF